jgi:hypothetical protein
MTSDVPAPGPAAGSRHVLVETLVEAAATAIRNQAPAITAERGYVRSLTLELELANGAEVVDSTCWVERRGVHRRRAR